MEGFGLQSGDFTQSTGGQPFSGSNVGCLGVHIDQPMAFLYRDEIEFGFAVGVLGFFTPDSRTGLQQLPATAGIFYMADLRHTVYFDISDETVGAGKKKSGLHAVVFHSVHILFYRITDFYGKAKTKDLTFTENVL
jgi:hypothetical protein